MRSIKFLKVTALTYYSVYSDACVNLEGFGILMLLCAHSEFKSNISFDWVQSWKGSMLKIEAGTAYLGETDFA